MSIDSKVLAQVLYRDQSLVELIGVVTFPNKKCRGEKWVYWTSFEEINKSTYEWKQCKACSHVLNIPFKHQKPSVTLFGWTYCFTKKTNLDYQKEKLSSILQHYIHQSKPSTTKAEEANIEPVPKKQRFYLIWNNRVTLLLSVLLQHKFTFLLFIQTFLQLTTHSFTINTMEFTVSNNGTQWVLDFGPDSVVLSVKDLDENLTIGFLEFLLAAWSLLRSQRQEFLNNHLPRVPITPKQQGTFEMRERSTLQRWSTRYRHEGIQAIGSKKHWIQLGRSCSGCRQCQLNWNCYPVFPIHLWRSSDGGINRWQPNKSWRWGRLGEFSSNNNNTRVWASNQTSQITEKSSIRESTKKCTWIRIQDSVSLNFVCICIWYIACVLYIQVINFFFLFLKLFSEN